ncbi:MAG: hypothetical protein CL610_18485 [Anaerolineaceae bacterium]|nr:hypothetical protein [Anaerolineaceae bacterium]
MNDLVFLAYSFKDIRRARRLRESLRQHGLRVWPDRTLMPGTPDWKTQVQKRLAEAGCVVVILSKDAPLSRWVWQIAGDAHHRQIPILPVLMDGDAGHILLVELEGEDWFDLRWSKNYAREVRYLVDAIRQYTADATVTIKGR